MKRLSGLVLGICLLAMSNGCCCWDWRCGRFGCSYGNSAPGYSAPAYGAPLPATYYSPYSTQQAAMPVLAPATTIAVPLESLPTYR